MRTSTLGLAAALASVVCGADVPGLPSCAASCVTNFGSCNQLDVKCICSSKTLIADLACCVSKVCDAAAQASTITFANALCQGQGVNDLPQTATCASTAASATAPASTPSAAANSTSNATAATTSSAAMVMSSAAASSGAAGTATGKPTTTATTTAASSTATAGAMATASVEWLGAAGLGVLFAALVAAM